MQLRYKFRQVSSIISIQSVRTISGIAYVVNKKIMRRARARRWREEIRARRAEFSYLRQRYVRQWLKYVPIRRCETRGVCFIFFNFSRPMRCFNVARGSCAVPVVARASSRAIRERMSLDACPLRDSEDVVAVTNCIALSHRSYVPFSS